MTGIIVDTRVTLIQIPEQSNDLLRAVSLKRDSPIPYSYMRKFFFVLLITAWTFGVAVVAAASALYMYQKGSLSKEFESRIDSLTEFLAIGEHNGVIDEAQDMLSNSFNDGEDDATRGGSEPDDSVDDLDEVPSPTTFEIGDIIETLDAISVRENPGSSEKKIGSEKAHAMGTVMGGPLVVDTIEWVYIQYDDDIAGWSSGEFLKRRTDMSSELFEEPTPPPPPPKPTTLPVASAPTHITKETVALHAKKSDCWFIVSGKVYDVTQYIPFHPGGESVIISYCGKDATTAFNTKGGGGSHSANAVSLLGNYLVGALGSSLSSVKPTPTTPISTTPAPTTTNGTATAKTCTSFTYNSWSSCQSNNTQTRTVKTSSPTSCTGGNPTISRSCTYAAPSADTGYTTSQVASHNSSGNCWFIVSGKVYDVTQYIPFHPGGASTITSRCGTDATTAFNTKGGSGSHSSNAVSLLGNYLVGTLSTTPPTGATCTSFTYNSWGACQSNNTQTRTVNTSSPPGCTGGSPVTSQSCTYTTPTTCSTFTYSGWGSCQSNNTQTRTVQSSSPSGCTGGSPVTSQSCTYTPPTSGTSYTPAQVAGHTTSSDCWFIISNNVYNVTQYIPFHPGGANAITSRCGTDATTAFNTKGGGGGNHSTNAVNLLGNYLVGTLSTTPPTGATCTAFTYTPWGACQSNNTQTRTVQSSSPSGCTGGSPVTSQSCTYTPPTGETCSTFTYSAWGSCQSNNTQTRTVQSSSPSGCTGGSPVTSQSCTYTPPTSGSGYTTSQVATHNTSGNCWLIISGKVYDVTQYIPFHPGGTSRITSRCGTDATTVFTSSGGGGHNHSTSARNTLAGYLVGDLVTTPTTCSTFTYSSWGSCQPDGTQTRTVNTSSPSGCTGGSPVTSQSCTYTPPTGETCSTFTYSGWGSCQSNNTQTRTVQSSSPSGCTGGSPVTSQSCTYTPPASNQTHSVNVDSSGNFSQTSLTLNAGDSIKFIYTSGNGEAKVTFSPSTVSSFTLDKEKTQQTRTFASAGTWTVRVQDKSGNNTLTVTVQ